MKWKPLFAVLLGLLMVRVTARSASARVFSTSSQTANVGGYRKMISLPPANPYQ